MEVDIMAAASSPAFKTVANVPIVSTGTYQLAGNPYPGGETTFTSEDLADAVAAVNDPAVALPRLKLGHMSDWGDAEPAFGKLDNLRLGDNGQTIYADFVGVPAWLADVLPSAYPSRSIEAGFNVTTPGTGKEYRMVISALALLGVVLPGVATLEDLAGVYTEAMPEGTVIEEDDATVVAAIGGNMKLRRKASGSVNSEDVRRAYYDNLGPDQWAWWIRAMYLDPNELIVDDDEGNLYRIPFTLDGEEVTFGEATEVKIQFVNAGGRHADGPPPLEAATLVYASRSESRPGTKEQEDQMDILSDIKKKLGLSEDASEDEVLAKLDAKSDETDPAEQAADDNASVQAPGESEGNPADQGPETATPSPTEQAPAEPVAASGAVTVDPETLASLQRDAAAGRVAREKQVEDERNKLVDEAIKAGKFPPSRRDHWLTSLKHDPEGAQAAIASLEPGLVPVEEKGSAPAEEQLAVAAYPQEWLSPAERARAQGQTVSGPGQIIEGA